ncbi:MAG: histidine kinase, partial [Rhodothermales bacterium]|nr:histidine kinase [Rhodothermales bacterium]
IRRVHLFTSSLFAGERRQARQDLARFQSNISDYLDAQVLVSKTIEVIGSVFDSRSAVLYVMSPAGDGSWVMGNYHPEPPYLTERVFHRIWPHFEAHPDLWASNQQLNENKAPADVRLTLANHNVALVVPIRGDGRPTGLIVLGPKAGRRAVYNLEDLDLLRSLSGQLALAVARLGLVEREKELAAESTEARLVALRAQINPHFLFNALNTILSLISERPEEAETVVEKLAAIFRYTLQAGSKPFVSMQEELTLVEDYLSIEKARFGENLEVECRVDDALRRHPVPAFAVQTIVENAIKHGLERKRGGGRVEITAGTGDDGEALVTVTDTGIGIPGLFGRSEPTRDKEPFFGIGLENVHDRLRQLFGHEDLLRIRSSPDGTTVTLRLPERRPENLTTPQPAGADAGNDPA